MKGFFKLLGFLGVVCLCLYLGQALIFLPGLWDSRQVQIWKTPSLPPVNVKTFLISSGDNAELEGWFYPPIGATSVNPVALLLHSEASTLRRNRKLQKQFAALGWGVYSFDYRGYGKSTSWPTEAGMRTDAESALTRIAEMEKRPPPDVILIGDSRAASIVSFLAAKIGSRQIILINPALPIGATLGSKVSEFLRNVSAFEFPFDVSLQEMRGSCVSVLASAGRTPDRLMNELKELLEPKNTFHSLRSSTSKSSSELVKQFEPQLRSSGSDCGSFSPKS